MEGFFIVKDITYERLATKNPIGVDGCIIALSKGYGHLTDTSLHWHHAFELTLVLESDIRYTADGAEHYVSCGDFLFINSGVIHQTQNANKYQNICGLVLVIPDTMIKELVPEIDCPYFRIEKDSKERMEILESLYRMEQCIKNPQRFHPLLIRSELFKILYLLYTYCYDPDASNTDYNVASKTVINYVGEHYMENLSIPSIANLVGLQETYFCRKFKKETGISFHQYLSRIRLDAALALYNSDHYSLLDCALQAGFTSEKVMIDWCRKIYQCTPAQYKIQKKLTGLYR